MNEKTLRSSGRSVEVSRADKVLYPQDGITKGDIAEYYRRVGSTVVRYTDERPLAAERYPDGIEGQRIFQKNVPAHTPKWIERAPVPKKEGGETVHMICAEPAALIHLADQACLTPHVWLSRVDDLQRPDRMILDLDPSGNDLRTLRSAARSAGDLLEELGLTPFVMTTGSRGFHVLVPLRREQTFDQVRDFARDAATVLAEREPRTLTVEQRKTDRSGRVFVDYLRNAYAQTTVTPYAVRARKTAPVATPISWQELDRVEPWGFTIHDVQQRLDEHGDEWSSIGNRARSLERPRRLLDDLVPST
ncbi:bifunctional non-homologous end joining protein LigD [Actinopolyspora biskrensis]|uniref:Bifunctional non-homologous end joining protein LigD n=1 Tax=Actinopolyspora biskrensis TaxID=1470178 RepID=A0A852YWB3_9ACTN|nr:non-homologous end-joining DNA ligase [Actinopolyspora biskrensis]NYH77849.1 bifunctional non-homologous end joining protein LigD [Actinopolyspora biskrensis]